MKRRAIKSNTRRSISVRFCGCWPVGIMAWWSVTFELSKPFGLQQCSSCQRGCKCLVITQTFQDAGAFGIDVITQIGSVYTWIGSHFLLIQRLNDFQRLISGIGKLPVAFHLQRSQVKQAEWRLPPLFLGDIRHGKRRILNLVQ